MSAHLLSEHSLIIARSKFKSIGQVGELAGRAGADVYQAQHQRLDDAAQLRLGHPVHLEDDHPVG